MNEREKTIRLWFDMWLNQQDMGIDDIFTEDVIYTETVSYTHLDVYKRQPVHHCNFPDRQRSRERPDTGL